MPLSLFSLLICAYVGVIVSSERSSASGEFSCGGHDWFECPNGRCLSSWFVCDGEDDCGDNSDESNCTDRLRACDFRCDDGICLKSRRVCDGFDDCLDASDEIRCGDKAITAENCDNEVSRFLCDNGRCIFLDDTCNKINDCGDNSDENEIECQNAEDSCKNAGCSHSCNKTPRGPLCSCPFGHILENNKTCTDIDECSGAEELCDQRCVNAVGSYSCVCEVGYDLQDDGRTCRAEGDEAMMIYASTRAITRVYLNHVINFPTVENLRRVRGVATMDERIYWSDIENRTIMRSDKHGRALEVVATAGLALPEAMAIDWITGNVYFIDDFWKHIGVCKNDGEYCTIILCESIRQPGGLVLHPKNGEMFWSDRGDDPKIFRSSMDGGTEMVALVEDDLGSPKGLAIDHPNDRLYWYDEKREMIESILTDGTERRAFSETTGSRIYGLALFENKLYFSDWHAGTVVSVDRSNVEKRKTVVEESEPIYGIHIEHPVLREKLRNPCENQSCSQLCLLASNLTFSCACKSGDRLMDDGRSCGPAGLPPSHLVIASGDKFIRYRHETLGKPRIDAEPSSKRVSRLAGDPLTGSFIANDDTSNGVFRFTSGLDEIRQVGTANGEFLRGLDFDHRGNNVYSTNVNDRTIQVQSVETGGITVFPFDEEPHDIALVPKYGLMYVVFKTKYGYRIDRLSMNGAGGREAMLDELLEGPRVSLARDDESERIFFSDESSGIIGTMSVFGEDRRVLRTNVEGIVDLATTGRRVFWTLRRSNVLQWIDERDRFLAKNTVVLPVKEIVEMMDIAVVGRIRDGDDTRHACRSANGGCSHVCLVGEGAPSNETAVGRVCACPAGMSLNSDNRTCELGGPPRSSGGSEKCQSCALSR